MIFWIFPVVLFFCHAFCNVTLANLQKFGFEFRLRSSPFAFSGWSVDRQADFFIACYTVLTRPNKVKTALQGCNSWLSVWTLSCRCPVKLSTNLFPRAHVFFGQHQDTELWNQWNNQISRPSFSVGSMSAALSCLVSSGKNAGSFPEQRLVIEPTTLARTVGT